jgi:hypothetical protein
MVTNILLSVLVILFVGFLVMMYIWWKNFGSDLIKTTKKIMEMNNKMIRQQNNGKNPTMIDQLKIIRDFFNNRRLR